MRRISFWHKDPWEKVACNFVLQEYTPGHGWSDITEAAGEIARVDECREHFKPGSHYRLMAKAVEDSPDMKIKGGTFVGVVWKYYEPLPGGVVAVKEKPKPPAEKTRPKDPTEAMKDYAGEVKRVLEPIKDISLALNELRESLFPEGVGGSPPASSGEGEGSYYGGVPPPEFEGKIPVWMHPYVVHTIATEIKGVIEYGATRLEGILGKSPLKPPGVEAEVEEEFKLPSISTYAQPPEAPVAPAGLEEQPLEERVEEGEELEEEEPSEEEVETVPSLIEKGKPCAQCGKVVPLLPNGLCESCAKELAKELEHEEEIDEKAEAEEEEEESGD